MKKSTKKDAEEFEDKYGNKKYWIRIMEIYHFEDSKKGAEMMCDLLDHFIWLLMKRHYPTYAQNKDVCNDLYNEAIIEILKSMYKYDPNKTSPSTYFGYFILGGFHRAIEDIYDCRNSPSFKRIQKTIKQFEEKNLPLIETDIAAAAKTSVTDVIKYFEYKNAHDFVYLSENPEVDMDIKQKTPTPEEQFFENEKQTKIHQAMLTLSEQEKKVIYTYFFTKPDGSKKRHDYDTVAKATGIPKDLVQLYFQRALKTLKKNPELKDFHYEKFSKYSTPVEFINHNVSIYDCIGDENDNSEPIGVVKADDIYVLKPYINQ